MKGGANILIFKTVKPPNSKWDYLLLDLDNISPEVKKIINDVKNDPELKGKATWMLEKKFYDLLSNKYPQIVEEKKTWTRNNYDAITSVFSTGSLY